VKRTSELKGAVVIGRWEGYVVRSLTCCCYKEGDEPSGLYNTYEMINDACVPVILEGRDHFKDAD
jgi:hypothetical protein